ncbi:NAD-dependent epimerase/dehydratase family protein [Gammaproteobacteria bacterium]|nr:NAD-dependent epimerase/dehydratase family protein [Gammaproteobacteria bacterium]
MKKILIIGETGFIGEKLSKFLKRFHHVYPSDENNSLSKNISRLDINNVKKIKEFIEDKEIDEVIHLASNLIPASTEEEFIEEKNNLLEASKELILFLSLKKIRLIFFSSGGQIYENSQERHHEAEILSPQSFYGQSKIFIENEILKANDLNNFPYLILRPSNIYGTRPKEKDAQGIISIFIHSITNNSDLVIFGDGAKIRDYIYINDVLDAVLKIITNESICGVFNLTSGEEYSILEILSICEKACNKKAMISFVPERDCDPHKTIFDNSKLMKSINIDITPLEIGIAEMHQEISG